jgi:hypothetical protein
MVNNQQSMKILLSKSLFKQYPNDFLFISEGVRVNLTPISTFDRSTILNYLMQMINVLLQNEVVF